MFLYVWWVSALQAFAYVDAQIKEPIREDIEVYAIPLHKHSHLLCFKFPHIEMLIAHVRTGHLHTSCNAVTLV